MPAIVKILVVFAGMLALARLRVPLGLALIVGSATLNLWAGATPAETMLTLWRALFESDLWLLLVITILIEMSRFVTEGRNAQELMAAAQRWGGRHGRIATLVALPAVIGLIPMAAGALVSAPFVQQASIGSDRPAAWKAAVNYWFRHIWEFWWPLYPGVIVAMSIFGLDTWQFMTALLPFTPVAAVAGYFFLIRPHISALTAPATAAAGNNRRALLILLPLLVTVVAMLALPFPLKMFWPGLHPGTRKMLAMLIGLTSGLGLILADEWRVARTAVPAAEETGIRRRMFSTLRDPAALNIIITLAGGLLFKTLLEQSRLLPSASHELMATGIPVGVAVAGLPFLAGFITGMSVGFAGTAFPLVIGLLSVPGSKLTPWATLVLAYGFGYAGMMLSPVHLCLLATKDFFVSALPPIYRHVWPCVAVIILYSIAAHILLLLANW